MLVTYDTMDDDDAKFGVGLGCNGIIQVLIEPIQPARVNNPLAMLKSIASQRQKAILVTVFSLENKKDPQQGTCLLLKENSEVEETEAGVPLRQVLMEDAEQALQQQQSVFKNYVAEKTNLTAFIEMVPPAVSLIIIGAGNDVMPLVEMADILGWESTVVDGRPAYAKQERFISACQVIVSKPEDVLGRLSIDDQTVFLLMTHNYNYDMAMLKELVKKELSFIGMLGPAKKLQRMLNEMSDEGINLSKEQMAMIHSPVGLNIGAETPEEIALSILAEIKAVLSGKQGTSLRKQGESIHARSATTIEEVRVTSNP